MTSLRPGRAEKGCLRRYLRKVTGLSRVQMTRLIAQFRERGHLYNLRHSRTYRRVRGTVNKAHPVKVAIGERRKPKSKPKPSGRPGFLRVDSVHQGDLDGIKGLYHINLVDEITQFPFLGSLERLSERFLLPARFRGDSGANGCPVPVDFVKKGVYSPLLFTLMFYAGGS